ncbi:NAD-dependent epimerase/dehydratase family protein [Longimicrobium sp.]|uniref:NAD-dependent epimerase/dehydratase family protein n=1 Tax=Longimicrobium sp. TaxID=2029185 RepID=UPI002E30E55A|nr:NAD-dependent epimerase/dehydratase family protein [Longimicrobium sp.]HEX6036551.1 NAD-dependent epimerase/dehydratase family protein [Longimicrobium sp.]
MSSRTALITGATGFVGGHLVRRLAQAGWKVRALVRATSDTRALEQAGAERFIGDLDSVDVLAHAADGADTVFHLAALTIAKGEAPFIRANVTGTRNVVRGVLTAQHRPRRLVYLSSYAACGPARSGRPRTHGETPEPLTAYGRTKLQGEAAVHEAEQAGVQTVILRAPPVYGPGDRALLPYFRLVKRRLAPAPAGPELRTHMVYVEDLAAALARAADAPPGTYAVAEPVEHRWSAVVGAMADSLGTKPVRVPLPPAAVRAAGTVAGWFGGLGVFNKEKAEEMLAPAWLCDLTGLDALLPPGTATPLADGVRRTAQWYLEHGWV